jgi:hypothetical protein
MEEDNELDNERVIINTPKIMTLSNKSSIDKKLNSDDYKKVSLSDKRVSAFLLDNDNNFERNEKKTKTVKFDGNEFFMKNDDNNSTTCKSSNNDDKIKKVTFSTIEIIRVKNYKRLNKINSAPKIEEVDESDKTNCIIY